MNSLGVKIKKFLSNKNTVTIIGIVIAVLVLYFGYTWRVNKATEPVKVPYALTTIQPKTEITDDMIGYMNVARSAIKEGTIIDAKKIIGKYSNINTMIPEGSMFYTAAITTKEELPDSALFDVPEGETLYYLPVNMTTSYNNLMMPGNYIDIYIQTTSGDVDENGKVTSGNKAMVGKFLSDIKILAVKTSDGKNVFDNTDETRTPAMLIFSVPEEYHLLLRKAAYIGNIREYEKIDIIPIPKTTKGSKENDEKITTTISSSYIKQFIEERSAFIPLDELENNDNSTTNDNNQNNTNQNNNNQNNDVTGAQ